MDANLIDSDVERDTSASSSNQSSKLSSDMFNQQKWPCYCGALKTSKYRGVSYVKGKDVWRARIECDGRRMHIGCFKTEQEAAMKYDEKSFELRGYKGAFNFPEEIRKRYINQKLATKSSACDQPKVTQRNFEEETEFGEYEDMGSASRKRSSSDSSIESDSSFQNNKRQKIAANHQNLIGAYNNYDHIDKSHQSTQSQGRGSIPFTGFNNIGTTSRSSTPQPLRHISQYPGMQLPTLSPLFLDPQRFPSTLSREEAVSNYKLLQQQAKLLNCPQTIPYLSLYPQGLDCLQHQRYDYHHGSIVHASSCYQHYSANASSLITKDSVLVSVQWNPLTFKYDLQYQPKIDHNQFQIQMMAQNPVFVVAKIN